VRDDQVGRADAAGSHDLLELADALRALADRVGEDDGRPALEEFVRVAADRVSGATGASLTVLRAHHFGTEASSDPTARCADALQYATGSGPALASTGEQRMFLTGDVAADQRCARWGQRVHAELGVTSVLSQRLTLLGESDVTAALNIYSEQPNAFDEHAVALGLVLASHASLLMTATLARGRSTHLMRALASNREIGVAMGILMQRHQVSREEAFELLRKVSQDTNRKLSVVASDVADTGILADAHWPLPVPEDSRAG
jgi:hypothetical protein